MAEKRTSIHGHWSGRWAFILAATGSAVGLGNIWKFPYITGENGGGAFVIVYLICIAIIGIPVMMAEVLIGRRGRQSPINTMSSLASEMGRHRTWRLLGWGGVVAGFLILSYYSVIAGWALAYVVRTAGGVFTNVTADGVSSLFSQLVSDPERLMFWHTLFMVMTTVVVSRGVRSGLEKAVRFLMPLLFILLIILVGYAMNSGQFDQGLSFLFNPDFSKITGNGILVALGHAFFTLSLGMGAIMVYGSYLPQSTSISRAAFTIAILDTVVALMAGMAIFPLVFANNLEAGSGPGLIFQTLPLAFGHMPGGLVFGTLFFLLLTFAAWTSAISLIEPAVAYLVENRGLNRVYASTVIGISTWLLGIATVLSFNILGDFKPIAGKTIFDMLDYLTANIMLPLGGLFIALFAGWAMSRSSTQDELAMKGGSYELWHFVIRYVSPPAIIIVFLKAIGVIG
jgi:NSS family neurotransmitter:Na+ symporter